MHDSQDSIYHISGKPVNGRSNAPSQHTLNNKDLEVLILAGHFGELNLQKLADYEGKKRFHIQRADLELDGTEEEKKKSEGNETSLDKYSDLMQDSQESIYYVSDNTMDVVYMGSQVAA